MDKFDSIKQASASFQPASQWLGKFQYGTAGFRMKSEFLDSVVFRMGLLASLRSRYQGGKTIGVMITASHNGPQDNGVKLVDPMGDMLEASWENYATELSNALSDDESVKVYEKIASEQKIDLSTAANVIYARDTRASGQRLVSALIAGLDACNAKYIDYRIATTPMLHYYVRCLNTKDTPNSYGEPSEQGYYQKLAKAFVAVMDNAIPMGGLTVDCANGVGGPKLTELVKYLPSGLLDIKILNDNVHQPEKLNYQCGADFVKTTQSAPPSMKPEPQARCCSLDGDADRLIYYYVDDSGVFHLLDGDRISILAAGFIRDIADRAGLSDLGIGVVQTAYANGASTNFITKNLRVPAECTPTGVKHLHHAAQKFHIGVYFEPNGHGTVLFSDIALKRIFAEQPESPAQQDNLIKLRGLTELINQTVGDALSDMLMVEAVLAHKRWSPADWFSTYKDLPNRLARVEVTDRNVFKTVPGTAERRLEAPIGIQEAIDEEVRKYSDGRSFVRASGTEDAVRVYAEARTNQEVEDLCRKVEELVKRYSMRR